MIVRGELQETHKKRLASLDRPAHVHVMPLGAMSSEGLGVFQALAKAFRRHRFYLAARAEDQDPEILQKFKKIGAPNIHTWVIEGGVHGAEISRWHTRMEKLTAADSKVGSRGDQG